VEADIIRFVRIIGLRSYEGHNPGSPLCNGLAGNLSEMPSSPSWISSSFLFFDLRHDTIMKTAKCGIGGQFSEVLPDL